MTPTRKEVVRVARECGAFLELSTTPEKDMAFLLRFAERFYEDGAAAAREQFYGQDKPDACRNGCPVEQVCDYCQIVKPVQEMIAKAAAEAREPLVEALQPFVLANSSEEYITLVVRTDDVTKARAAIAKATGEKA